MTNTAMEGRACRCDSPPSAIHVGCPLHAKRHTPGGMTEDQAREILRAGTPPTTSTDISDSALWRIARGRAHPDRHGGDWTAFYRVELAARVLGLR